MKLSAATISLLAASASAFSPSTSFSRTTSALKSSNFDLSGNNWKPDSDKMGSTDTGDYYPEGYDANNEIDFTSGMMGSQARNGEQDGPQLPGMENLGEDAIMMGGIEQSSEIPAGMEFIPSSVPDGEFKIQVASQGSAETLRIECKPVCMTFEDFFAALSPDSHPCFSVGPATGRMDRRGGESTFFDLKCDPNGQAGDFTANLVINLPEDNSKICYKITATCF